MSSYSASIVWERNGAYFTDHRYSRVHRWRFDGGAEVPASSSPQIVPAPLSDASCVDPEEAFVASLSSCHMLFFLSFAAARGLVVERYVDQAEGILSKDESGRLAIVRVVLRPQVQYGGPVPDAEVENALHDRAHASCFIANSVRTEVVVEPEHLGEDST